MSELLAFDLDGPILDVSAKYHAAYAQAVRELGGAPLPRAGYWEAKRRRADDALILARSGLGSEQTEAFRARREALIETEPFLARDVCWPGVREALLALARRAPLVVVTLRRSRPALLLELERLGLASAFAHVLSAPGDADRAATKARLVRGALPPFEGGWFTGDTETDLRAGEELGLRTVAVTFGIRTRELLAACRPARILESPEELVAFLSTL